MNVLPISQNAAQAKQDPPNHRTPADILKSGLVDMPAADAALILRECRFPTQTRDLTVGGKNHIDVLAEIMRRGQWRPMEKLDFARVGDRLYVLNGHHRLGGQVATGKKMKWLVAIHDCDSFDDARRLYHTFDTNIRGRSTPTIVGASGLADELRISKTNAVALYNAVPLITSNFGSGRVDKDPIGFRMIDERLDAARQYGKAAFQWEQATDNAAIHVKKRLRNQGALAVALVCFRYQPVVAAEFWGGVASNDGLVSSDPRNTYLSLLVAPPAGGSTAWTIAMQASIAWNAYFARRPLKIIKVYENSKIKISGTFFEE